MLPPLKQSSFLYKSKTRYYRISLRKSLFGELVCIVQWGGLKNQLGGFKIKLLKDRSVFEKEAVRIHRKRLSRGYILQ